MTSRDFCYWLQGFFEIGRATAPSATTAMSPEQAEMIRRHLALVFQHEIDPSAGDAKQQAALNKTHGGSAIGGSGPDGVTYRC